MRILFSNILLIILLIGFSAPAFSQKLSFSYDQCLELTSIDNIYRDYFPEVFSKYESEFEVVSYEVQIACSKKSVVSLNLKTNLIPESIWEKGEGGCLFYFENILISTKTDKYKTKGDSFVVAMIEE